MKPHSHPSEDVELFFLFGRATFSRRNLFTHKLDTAKVGGLRDFGRKFTIRYFHEHWFQVSDRTLVFFNWQVFHKGHPPVSAAVDFRETT